MQGKYRGQTKRRVSDNVRRRRDHFSGIGDGEAELDRKCLDACGAPGELLQSPQRPTLAPQDVIDGRLGDVRQHVAS
jgi:hypothetical protein